MAPLGTDDPEYGVVTAKFFKATLAVLGPKLVTLYGQTGELHSSSYAFWLTKQMAAAGNSDTHRWIDAAAE